MKSTSHKQQPRLVTVGGRQLAPRLATLLAMIVGLLLSGSTSRADQGNQLVNPGFETGDNTGWATQGNAGAHNATATYYNAGMCPADTTPENVSVFAGTYVGNLYGTFSAAISYSYYQQTLPTVAGSTWSASVYAYASHEDLMGINNFVVQVTFLDKNNALLTQYQSLNVTNLNCAGTAPFPLDTWVQLLVTNQVQNGAVVATLPSGVLTAPAGTATIQYQLLFENVNWAGGSIYLDEADLDLVSGPLPPTISPIVPNDIIMCNSNKLTYTVTSPSGIITNVSITSIETGLPGTGTSNNVTYAVGSPGLSVVGLGTNIAVVTLTLKTNTAYTLTAYGTDNNGITVSTAGFLDTFQPTYLFEAEDFNYNGGQWVTTVTADGGMFAYANLVGTEGIDEFVGTVTATASHVYRPNDTVSVGTAYEETPGGLPLYRQKFLDYFAANPTASTNADTVDEEVGYVNAGDWQDYTRNFPAGKYNVYARQSVSGNSTTYFEQVLTDPTQSSQTVTNLGTFSLTDGNWNYYEYVPLLDQYGNLISVSLGGTQTVRILVGTGSGANQNFFMIVPAVTIPKPVLQASYPNGLHPFEPTNHFMFTVGQGAGSPISAGGIQLILNGSDVTAQVTFTSTSTNWTGVFPIATNTIYSAVINVTNSTHLSSSYSVNFDTFTQSNYMFEAEDFDFNGGSYIDNPVPTGDSVVPSGQGYANGTLAADSYYAEPEGNAANAAIGGIDYYWTADGQSFLYRAFETPGTQLCSDYLRQKFLDSQVTLNDPFVGDFNIGWYNAGFWLNYTRHYPAGTYNIYGRLAGGNGAFTNTILSVLTSGWGTSLQTSNVLGTFADPNAAGWQTWHWVPMMNAAGTLATVTFTGSTNTLTLTSGNNLNVNFLMLVPAVAAVAPLELAVTHTATQVSITFPTQQGHSYTVLSASGLTAPVTWTTLTTISGTGSPQTATDTVTGTARFYRVATQ